MFAAYCILPSILICFILILDRRKDMDHEFAVLFTIFDENRSWYIKENTYKYTSRPETVNPLDPGFILSNRMHGNCHFLAFLHKYV